MVDPKLQSKLQPFNTIEDFKARTFHRRWISIIAIYIPSLNQLFTFFNSQVLYPPEELGANGKRSRNPSTGSGYGGVGIKINRYFSQLDIRRPIFVNPLPPDVLVKYKSMFSRNRRASEGDNWTEVGGGARASKRGSR